MSSQKIATLTNLPNGLMLRMDVPYNSAFQTDFKSSVPSKKRIWDKENSFWYVAKDQLPKLQLLLGQHFTETILLDFPAPEVAPNAWATLYLIPETPLEVVQAVYRTLAKRYHPDTVGQQASADIMVAINEAYRAIQDYYNSKEV